MGVGQWGEEEAWAFRPSRAVAPPDCSKGSQPSPGPLYPHPPPCPAEACRSTTTPLAASCTSG